MDQHLYVKSAKGDGLLGYVRGGQLLVRPFDARTARLAGPERLVVAGVAGFGAGLGRLWDSGGGSLAYFLETARPSDLTWFSRQGEKGAALEPVAGVRAFRLSPDEKALAYGVTKPGEGIRLLNLERGGTAKISFGKDAESYPVWSPEGKWVAYSSRGGEKNRIYRRLADGSGQEETLLEGNDVVYPLSWSPDGKWLLYSGGFDGRWNLYLLPLSGDRKPVPFAVDPFDKYDARFSPDGRLIAYSSTESGVREVYVRPAPGETGLSGRWQISSDGGSHAQWRKDGKELYYWTADQLMAAGIEREATTLRVGKPEKLFGLPSTTNPRTIYEASGDGKRFLVRGSITEDLKAFVVVNWEARGTQ
jgi:Tol biopolymer transport system component